MKSWVRLLFLQPEHFVGRSRAELSMLQLAVILGLITSVLLGVVAVGVAGFEAWKSRESFLPAFVARLVRSSYLANCFVILGVVFTLGYPLVQLSFFVADGIGGIGEWGRSLFLGAVCFGVAVGVNRKVSGKRFFRPGAGRKA